ncbi:MULTISPECIES: TetR/AcrR family transcriptional regulator [unclassified Bosea (in: a-proteobacteria)]|uniref:TetR/AcrR family transcriptional regulator n=1 Tax=unclassified Bosea (in: a-proteobacteria) TaxID=2653178 RepID=UPI000F752ADF|nr:MULTISPECIES: TetR/AcrR family transcriptional regulator [unclassified Bosea (in: a-proteobacteria)]AZO80692.1 TetR family transcriptional regulator [Bosea sp. Tri-49]RXT25653.1 TetR family transcriptional regulator [Bosea sp. Tri-39]RXT30894.1 TetR family transcriptional regulator [Bosea sp. Tri-54]
MARTRAADFDDKRRSILDSAAAVFATLGMERASMAQIAQENNVSKALLYHYYPSKDLLIFDIGRTHLIELEAAIIEADRPDLEPRARLRHLIGGVLENYRTAANFHQVLLNGTGSLTEAQRLELREMERRIVKAFSDVLTDINPALAQSRAGVTPITMSLFGILNWVYTWFRPSGALSREGYADMVTALFLDGAGAIK